MVLITLSCPGEVELRKFVEDLNEAVLEVSESEMWW